MNDEYLIQGAVVVTEKDNWWHEALRRFFPGNDQMLKQISQQGDYP